MSSQLACLTTDVPAGAALRVELDSDDGKVEIAIVRDAEGVLHAISDICSHERVSLSDGEVYDTAIECWLHGSTFDLDTGAPLCLPAIRPIPVYPLTVDGDRVLVDPATTLNA